ncbi:autotransporter domain-containing protein [Candidatus Pelagibacter bacterium]|nr:autotransporter domain-containing protein [Candidatus Pelagibacter bacterium]MDB2709025.1 autotransporter domain-containing protein [Candidatus Pelagibacter bacterium]
MRNLYKYLLISTFFFLYFSKSYAACPSGDNNQTVNIIASEACTTRISNPTSNVNVAGTNIVSNRGDGSLYWNTGNHTVSITGTVSNTHSTGNGIHDVAGSLSAVQDITISGSGSLNGTVSGYFNQGSKVNITSSQSDLTFKGVVPTSYKILIEGVSDFGKTTFISPTGTLQFDVASTSLVLAEGTYSSVLDDIASARISSSTRSGTFSTFDWVLQLASGSSDKWDLVFTNSRTSYTTRISGSLNSILNILEQINTDGSNSSLTSALDDLTDTSLEKVARQIEGVTIKKMSGQSFQKHSTFKRAVSSALSGPSVNSFTKNNYASLSLNDLSLPSDQSGYQVHSFNDFDFKSMANIFKNKDLFSLKSKGSTFFIRTFADQSNQDVVDGDAGYEASTAGFLVGNENNLSDKIQQGWALGLSASDTDFDDNFGNSDSKTLHAMIYQNQQYDNFNLGLNIGTYVTRADMNREITEGSIQTLKSKTYNYGFDITADIKQSYTLKNDFIFTPSFSTNISYILQDDLDESGGDLALSVNNDNLLIVKPEIGFALDKNFKNTETVSQNFGFSVYGSYEDKLEGTTSKAKIKDTGSNFDIVDDNTDDTFITAGLGFTSTDKEKNQKYNLGIYHTQNDDNDLNSTLLSYNFKQKF